MNSTFLIEKKNFKNPLNKSTFGNPNQVKKFNVKEYSNEYQLDFKGKYSPPVGYYNINEKHLSGFYTGDKEKAK